MNPYTISCLPVLFSTCPLKLNSSKFQKQGLLHKQCNDITASLKNHLNCDIFSNNFAFNQVHLSSSIASIHSFNLTLSFYPSKARERDIYLSMPNHFQLQKSIIQSTRDVISSKKFRMLTIFNRFQKRTSHCV